MPPVLWPPWPVPQARPRCAGPQLPSGMQDLPPLDVTDDAAGTEGATDTGALKMPPVPWPPWPVPQGEHSMRRAPSCRRACRTAAARHHRRCSRNRRRHGYRCLERCHRCRGHHGWCRRASTRCAGPQLPSGMWDLPPLDITDDAAGTEGATDTGARKMPPVPWPPWPVSQGEHSMFLPSYDQLYLVAL